MNKKNVLFLVNEKKDNTLTISKEIINCLLDNNVSVFVEESLSKQLKNVTLFDNQPIDFALVVGGDGTILNSAHKYKDKNFKYFGVNLGRVGALTDSSLENYKEKLNKILDNHYFVEERNVMKCKVYNNNVLENEMIAFNEVSIHRASLYKMLLINMDIDGHNRTSFYADGIIASTATGSSAYSLSCGGPLLLPSAKNFVLTPIAPQLRVITSLVVNDTEKITIDVKDKRQREEYNEYSPILFIDGAFRYNFTDNSTLEITKSELSLNIIKTNEEASLFEPIYKVSSSNSDLFTAKNEN